MLDCAWECGKVIFIHSSNSELQHIFMSPFYAQSVNTNANVASSTAAALAAAAVVASTVAATVAASFYYYFSGLASCFVILYCCCFGFFVSIFISYLHIFHFCPFGFLMRPVCVLCS